MSLDKTVSSWEELVRELHSPDLMQLRPKEGGHIRSPYVFRGMDVAVWDMQTSLERLSGLNASNTQVVERSLIRSFRKLARSIKNLSGTF